MSMTTTLRAFTGYGIELEYAIVDRSDLSCRPIADQLMRAVSGENLNEVQRGAMGWSNEMFMHVIEIKNLQPSASLAVLPKAFQNEVAAINNALESFNAQLMPGAMHPWMKPASEARLWPHANAEIYQAYDRIFDCRSHGWANLQSMHINLPFADDTEFERLHAAIRLVLPILPALAASSPVAAGKKTGFADYRMEVYRGNAKDIPSIAGQIIPEPVASRAEYQRTILAPMYRDIKPFDPPGILQYEWLNSRGAIARFDRDAIEIRVADTQECPLADLAIATAIVAVVKSLYEAGAESLAAQKAIGTGTLAQLLIACIRNAEYATIDDAEYLALLGVPKMRCDARQLWRFLLERTMNAEGEAVEAWKKPLHLMLEHGPLARRLLQALDNDYTQSKLDHVYRRLCRCLQAGEMFGAAP